MKILPKLYWFSIQYWRAQNGKWQKRGGMEGFVVARNEKNALKKIEEYRRKFGTTKRKYTIQTLEDNWFLILACMLLPRFDRASGKNNKWKALKK